MMMASCGEEYKRVQGSIDYSSELCSEHRGHAGGDRPAGAMQVGCVSLPCEALKAEVIYGG